MKTITIDDLPDYLRGAYEGFVEAEYKYFKARESAFATDEEVAHAMEQMQSAAVALAYYMRTAVGVPDEG